MAKWCLLETYGSRLAADAPAIEVHDPGDVYARDDFVYWGFPPRVCGESGGSSASTRSRSSTSWRSTATRGSSRAASGRLTAACARPAQAANDVAAGSGCSAATPTLGGIGHVARRRQPRRSGAQRRRRRNYGVRSGVFRVEAYIRCNVAETLGHGPMKAVAKLSWLPSQRNDWGRGAQLSSSSPGRAYRGSCAT